MIRVSWFAWAAAALMFAALVRGLPAETFYVGDPGVKLIAARDARPGRPLEIPLPSIGGQPAPYVEPFFFVHGDHSHAVTSEVFPLASAPFIMLFGIRGAYLLPAFGFFACLAACVRLAQQLDLRTSGATPMVTAALGTPFLFYGLEFWEHAPAVAVAAAAMYTWLSGRLRRGSDRTWSAAVSGLLFGIAILLRPEAVWFFIAVAAATRLLPEPPGFRSFATVAAGVVFTLMPLGLYSLLHFGAIIPPHVASNAGLLREGWLSSRLDLLSRWFVPDSTSAAELWGIALLSMILVGWLAAPSHSRSVAFLAAAALLDIVLVVLTAPNDGGGQWGPRYLLFAFVPAALLLAQAITRAVPSRWRTLTAVVAIGLGVWAQREGYRELQGTKRIYGRILEFVQREVPPGGTVVTDLWWLDQVAAAGVRERAVLFVDSSAGRSEVLTRLEHAGVPTVVVFEERDHNDPGRAPVVHPCYSEFARHMIPERSLVAVSLRHCANKLPLP